jgi:hypothetical protein
VEEYPPGALGRISAFTMVRSGCSRSVDHAFTIGRNAHLTRVTETEPEATAYVMLGLEPPSPAYIAWQGGTGQTVLRSLGRVQRAARRILEAAGCGLFVRAPAPVHAATSSLAGRQMAEAVLQ